MSFGEAIVLLFGLPIMIVVFAFRGLVLGALRGVRIWAELVQEIIAKVQNEEGEDDE